MAHSVFANQLPRQTPGPLHYLPIVSSPAIQSDQYVVDEMLIIARATSGAALSLLAMAGLYWVCPPFALFTAKHELICIGASLVLTYLPGIFEIWKASHAADELALQAYSKAIPPLKATDRLASSPRAFQKLLNSHPDLNKPDSEGYSLAERIVSGSIRYSSVGRGTAAVGRMLVNTDIDFLARNPNAPSLFMLAVRNIDSTILREILKSGKVHGANISAQDQAEIWKYVNHPSTIELLCQYGFNINAQDGDGNSPLIRFAQRNGSAHLAVAALNAKADPRLQNNAGQRAADVAPQGSLLQSLIQQAADQFPNAPVPLPQETGFMAWLPWKPLLFKDGFSLKEDRTPLMNRVYLLGLAAITLVFLAPSSMIGISAKLLTGMIVGNIPLVIEIWRHTKETRRRAVVEFLTNPVPSQKSATIISGSIPAARLLVEHLQGDAQGNARYLNKLDDHGQPLLAKYGVDLRVFKFLVEQGADILTGNEQSGFFQALTNGRADLIAFILDQRLVRVDRMSPALQFHMWTSVDSEQIALFLRQYGFNPNVKNAAGDTPLIHLARQTKTGAEKGAYGKIQALLNVGADRHVTNLAGENAKAVADPAVALLL